MNKDKIQETIIEIQEAIIKILSDTKHYTGKDHYVETVIEEKDPFYWRIKKEWAEKTANKIVEKLCTVSDLQET